MVWPQTAKIRRQLPAVCFKPGLGHARQSGKKSLTPDRVCISIQQRMSFIGRDVILWIRLAVILACRHLDLLHGLLEYSRRERRLPNRYWCSPSIFAFSSRLSWLLHLSELILFFASFPRGLRGDLWYSPPDHDHSGLGHPVGSFCERMHHYHRTMDLFRERLSVWPTSAVRLAMAWKTSAALLSSSGLNIC